MMVKDVCVVLCGGRKTSLTLSLKLTHCSLETPEKIFDKQ